MNSGRFTRNSFSSDSSRDQSTVDRHRSSRDRSTTKRPRSGFNAAFDLQSELCREEESSAPGSRVSSSHQEQSFDLLLFRSLLEGNTDTTLLETQDEQLDQLEGREALENQNQDYT